MAVNKHLTMRFIVVLMIVLLTFSAAAQEGDGQFCLRAFEDRNANGVQDANETVLQGGIGANLSNEDGIIIASALLDDSPTRSQGTICFEFLESGQYTMNVTSASYTATTPDTLLDVVTEGSIPSVMDFGAQQIAVEAPSTAAVEPVVDSETSLSRLLLSMIGGLVALIVMAALGFIIYLVALRNRQPSPTDTGTYYQAPPAPASDPHLADTGEHPRVQ